MGQETKEQTRRESDDPILRVLLHLAEKMTMADLNRRDITFALMLSTVILLVSALLSYSLLQLIPKILKLKNFTK